MDQFPRHIHGERCGEKNPDGLGRTYTCDCPKGHNPVTIDGAQWSHANLQEQAWWGPIPAVPLMGWVDEVAHFQETGKLFGPDEMVPLDDFLIDPQLRQFKQERVEAGLILCPVEESGQIDIDFLLKCVNRFIHETPKEATRALDLVSTRLVDLGLMANAKKTTNCTDWSAAWCALHGSCSCGDDRETGEFHDDCPLHGNDTDHAFEYEKKED